MSAPKPVRYTYPLVKLEFLADQIEREVGVKPLSCGVHHLRKETNIFFASELTAEQKGKLDSLIDRLRASPPSYYQYSQQAELADAITDVEAVVGVRPLTVGLDEQGRLASAVFERELTSREEDSLKPLLGKDYRKLVKRKL